MSAHTPTPWIPEDAIAWQYASPIDDGGWITDQDTLDEIRAQDPSLIVMIPTVDDHARIIAENKRLREALSLCSDIAGDGHGYSVRVQSIASAALAGSEGET